MYILCMYICIGLLSIVETGVLNRYVNIIMINNNCVIFVAVNKENFIYI